MATSTPPAPPDLAGQELRRHYMNVALVWDDISGDPATDAEVVAGFAELNTEAAVSELFVLSWLLNDAAPHANTPAVQGPIADWLLLPDLARAARERLGDPDGDRHRDAIVHHEQLLAATALALTHGQPGSPDPDQPGEAFRHRLGSLLLKVSSLLGVRVDAPESDLMLGATVRQAYVTSHEQPGLVSARNFDILIERAQQAHTAGKLSFDLHGDFVAQYGIEPLVFMGIGTLYALPWMNLAGLAQTPGAYWDAGRDLARGLERLGLDQKLLSSVVADRAWFERELEVRSIRTFSLLPLNRRPMLKLSDGGLLPLNWRLLLDRVLGGLFWAMHAAYMEQGGSKRLQQWMGEVGAALYQPYIDSLMRDVYQHTGITGRYMSEGDIGKYRRGSRKELVDGADGYIQQGRRLIVFDVTASAIPVNTMMSADGEAFRKDVQRFLIKGKLGQLSRVIGDIAAGWLVLPVGLDELDDIIPLVITAAPFPQFPTIWSHVKDAWTQAELFTNNPKIVPPQLLTFEELELMQASLADGSLSLAEVLIDREATYRGSPVKNFLAMKGVALPRAQRINEAFERFRTAVSDVMRGLGLPEN